MITVPFVAELPHALYFTAIVLSLAGVLGLDRRWRLTAPGWRLLRAAGCTLVTFLAFDGVGAARGWFFSNPRFSLAIVPPGVSLEEPFLLAFLAVLSISLWLGAKTMLL